MAGGKADAARVWPASLRFAGVFQRQVERRRHGEAGGDRGGASRPSARARPSGSVGASGSTLRLASPASRTPRAPAAAARRPAAAVRWRSPHAAGCRAAASLRQHDPQHPRALGIIGQRLAWSRCRSARRDRSASAATSLASARASAVSEWVSSPAWRQAPPVRAFRPGAARRRAAAAPRGARARPGFRSAGGSCARHRARERSINSSLLAALAMTAVLSLSARRSTSIP